MNVKDRERMDEFADKLNHLDNKVQNIYDALLDDERTSRIGLISEVEQMRKDLQVVMSAYKIGKWVVIAIATMFLGLIGNTFRE